MRVSGLLLICGIVLSAAWLGATQEPRARERSREPAGEAEPQGVEPARTVRLGGNAEHGRYIVEHVAMCIECHSPRDEQGNLMTGEAFTGSPVPFRPPWPNDWAIQAPRIRGLPGYTEELGVRLLTQGAIDRFGKQLRPPMPRFRMSTPDALDVVAFLKSMR
jgi:hypothetical protein